MLRNAKAPAAFLPCRFPPSEFRDQYARMREGDAGTSA